MKLIEYLVDIGITPAKFAKKANVSAPTIYNALQGKDIFLSIALRIEKATKHKVRCKDLLNPEFLNRKRQRVLPYRPKLKHSHAEYQQAQKHDQDAHV